MFGTILTVILTLIVVGGATGAAMYRVLDRGNSSAATNDGAVVEPIYESPSPSPGADQPAQQRPTQRQQTQEPTTIIVVPGHTASPTPTHDFQTEEPHETAEQDEGFETEEPTPELFEESPEFR